MKNNSLIAKAVIAISLLFTSTLAIAQLDIDIDVNKSEWYEDPKIWIGVAVFLLLLALISRNKK